MLRDVDQIDLSRPWKDFNFYPINFPLEVEPVVDDLFGDIQSWGNDRLKLQVDVPESSDLLATVRRWRVVVVQEVLELVCPLVGLIDRRSIWPAMSSRRSQMQSPLRC